MKKYYSSVSWSCKCYILPTISQRQINYLADDRIDILILDIRLKDTNGLEFLEKVKAKHPNLEVIMMTGHGDMDTEL